MTRPYLATLANGTTARLMAVSRAAAILTARELFTVEDGDW
jgi:hypothetical protein